MDNLESMELDQLIRSAQYGARLVADVAGARPRARGDQTPPWPPPVRAMITTSPDRPDPVAIIDAAILDVIKAARNGAPVKVLMGATAWLRAKNNAEVKKAPRRPTSRRRSPPSICAFRSLLFSEPGGAR